MSIQSQSSGLKKVNRFFIILFLIFFDFAIYIILGLVMLGFEDFYDESKGKYWSLESMTTGQKIAYLSWYLWYALNIALILYFVYKLVIKYRIKYKNLLITSRFFL